MLSTRVCTLPGRTAAHAWWTAWCHPRPGSRLNLMLFQKGCRVTCCMGQGIVLDVHKVTSKHSVAHGNIWFLRFWMYWCLFMAPSTTTSSLLPPWLIAPYTMTDGPRFPSLGWTQASFSPSPCLRRSRTRPSLWYRENRDSSLKIQCLHCLRSHTLCLLPHSRRRRLCSKVSLGHLAGDQYPAARSRLRMVRTDIRLPNRRIICIRRRGAAMKWFVLTIWGSWLSSRGVEIFNELPRFLWCGRSVSRLHRKILFMHPWDTPSILATSRWELQSADNLTIRGSICSGKFCGMIPFKNSKKYQ